MGLDRGNAVPQRFDVPWLTLSCVFTVLACTTAARAQEVVPPALPVCPQTIAGSPVGAMGADAVPAMPRQPARARWEVEFYGSLALRGGSREGILDLPPVGDPFNTTVGSLPSHRVPSWFFGDGAVLLNDSLAALPDPAAARIVPLDPLLTSSVAAPRRFGGLGVRLIRLVGRNAIELDIAYGSGIAVANAREQAEQTRLTFEQALGAMFSDASRFVDPTIVSEADVRESGGQNLLLTGAWRFRLDTFGRVQPFLLAGGGIALAFTDGPEIELVGRYSFRSSAQFGSRAFDETDRLTVAWSTPAASLVAVLGGGLTFETGARSALRFDVRVDARTSGVDTIVTTRPDRELQQSPATGVVFANSSPTVQFSNTNAAPSSLATQLESFTILSQAGPASSVLISMGYVRRF
jgi:hypothetical protein